MKQKEERYKNNNEMSNVGIMKKILQIYNIMQVLWSSKVKFVSLSQLLGCPLFGSNFCLFTVPGFIVSLVGIKKKKRRILLAQPVLLVFFVCSQLRWPSPALLCPNQHSGSLWASSPGAPDPQVQALTLLRAMGVREHGAFLIRTLPGACGLKSL